MSSQNRSFVIGPEPLAGWTTIDLGHAHLSVCDDLDRSRHGDRILLGAAFGPDGPPDLSGPAKAVLARARSWSGRWVLICDGKLYQDASGLLGVFRQGAWSSNSVTRLDALAPSPDVGSPVEHETGLDWLPTPMSRHTAVSRLPHDRVLDLRSGATEPLSRDLRIDPVRVRGNYTENLQELQALLRGVVASAGRDATRVVVPLTGGYDSRLLLALCVAADLDVLAITQAKPVMSWADETLPPQLAERAGVEHRWIPVGAVQPERLPVYDAHTSRQTNGIDRSYFARGQLDWMRDGDLILRGGAFEVGRCFYYALLPPAPVSGSAIAESLGETDPKKVAALDEWVRTIRPDIDWRDQFYIDQRLGGWASAVEQSLDLMTGRRFHAANSRRIFETLLALPEKVRKGSQHHVDMIQNLAPDLNDFPYNRKPRSIGRRIASRVKRLVGA